MLVRIPFCHRPYPLCRRVRAVGLSIVLLAVATAALAQAPARDPVSDGVGATYGEFRVDESGQAVYSIPIFAPPGTAGVQPALSLVYNSGGGNGPMGKGWSIGGQSALALATPDHSTSCTGLNAGNNALAAGASACSTSTVPASPAVAARFVVVAFAQSTCLIRSSCRSFSKALASFSI